MEVSSIDKKTNPPVREGRRRLTRAEKKRKRAEIVQQRATEKLEMCERIKTILVILLRITKKVPQGIKQIHSILNWLLSGRVTNVSWMDISENDFNSSDLTEMFTARFCNGNVSLMKRRGDPARRRNPTREEICEVLCNILQEKTHYLRLLMEVRK